MRYDNVSQIVDNILYTISNQWQQGMQMYMYL